jgi:integrase
MLRFVQPTYGRIPAIEFGPLALKAIRQKMIEADLSRGVINKNVGRIPRMFRWVAAEEKVPVTVSQALLTLPGLKKGRTDARETPPVKPVDDEVIMTTLEYLPSVVADMVRFQLLTGCRPGEVCQIRPRDINRSGEDWTYRPASHKTDHFNRERLISIGPKAQEVITQYLLRDSQSHCFSPSDSENKRHAEMRDKRRTPVQPSQVNRQKKLICNSKRLTIKIATIVQ